MVLTEYKSPEEIKHSLGDARRVAVFSCGGCANMNQIGGLRGMRFLRKQLREWGYEVVVAASPVGCCSTAVMGRAVETHIEPRRESVDALVQISCMAGIKNAFYFNPGLKVVAAADPMGVETLLPLDAYYSDPGEDLVAFGLCQPCGHCVLSFTTGICPYVECPSKSLYGPCENAPGPNDGESCGRDEGRRCVWRIIEDRGGDLEGLVELKRMHEDRDLRRIPSIERDTAGELRNKAVGFIGARVLTPLADLVHWIR
jgi:hypothetical protein